MEPAAGALVAAAAAIVAPIALVVGLGAWLRLAPLRHMAGPGRVLGWVVGSALQVRRAHAIASMRRAGVAAPVRTAGAMYAALGRGLFELLWVLVHPSQPLVSLVRVDPALLARIRSAPRGGVIATAHTGNWDLAGCAAAEHVPLTVATKRLSIRLLDRLWQGLRRRRGVRLAEAGQIARHAARALGAGEHVVMLIDQAPERERATIRWPFLGQSAVVDLAPALIAMRARVPLLAVFPRRCADGVVTVELCTAIEPPARAERRWAEEAMRELTQALDSFVRRQPDQWLWMHRRWKGAAGPMADRTVATAVVGVEPVG